MRAHLLGVLAIASLSLPAHAKWNGSVEFTEAEKAAHLESLPQIMDTASQCLEADLSRHNEFMKKYGVSAFYGDNSAFAVKTLPDGTRVATTKEEKREMLREEDLDEKDVLDLVPEGECKGGLEECPKMMQPTSCIGLVLKCLKKGLLEVGHQETWQKIRLFALANGSSGNSLIHALRGLGWKSVYWNPDTSRNEKWDRRDQAKHPGNPKNIWGQHAASWKSVQERRKYYFNDVDDATSLVNFGHFPPKWWKTVPFVVGIAHLGYHVFPATYGEIMEAHSTRKITDKKTVEKSKFRPLIPFGGPRGGEYNTGLMAVPPGYLDENE